MLKILKTVIEKIQGQLYLHLGNLSTIYSRVDLEMEILGLYLVAQEVENLGLL
jgi:hypothetical protein